MADRFTVTGPPYVPPAPGDAGSSVWVVVGAVASTSPMVKSTDLTASTLPATSVERYSTLCAPLPETVTGPRTEPASSGSTRMLR